MTYYIEIKVAEKLAKIRSKCGLVEILQVLMKANCVTELKYESTNVMALYKV